MKLSQPTSEIYVPDAVATGAALARTTHMAIAAHQDDIEIMALDGILPCFGEAEQWFLGVIVTDGAGSPRDGLYGKYTDLEMRTIRRVEQKKAAFVGEYGAAVFLDHPSSGIKNPAVSGPKEDLLALLRAARPRVVYTHNLADKHDTHVAVALRTIAAIRELASEERPVKLYGCEVWRDLDWMVDADKTVFQLDGHENIAAALLGVFDSQIAGGKRYDLATFGRRRAHATYHQSHGVDAAQMINFGMDLTPLVQDASLDIAGFVEERIARFSADVSARIGKSL
ncbi:MAG TPA: PIG-L family deacetylase [Paludibaculum sp.]|jgi:LmbE family N-acetylglucosaminyl deacetylase